MSGHGTNTEARQFQDGAVVSPPIRDLVLPDGRVRHAANRFDGRRVRLAGHVAPSLVADPESLFLSDISLAPCLLCGAVHGIAHGLPVRVSGGAAAGYSMHMPVEAEGVLRLVPPDPAAGETEPRLWLDEAVLRRAKAPAPSRADCRPAARAAPARPWLRENRPPPAPLPQGPAETILTNARIHTMKEQAGMPPATADATPGIDAVAIRDGRFLAVGSAEEMKRHEGPETRIVDLKGRTVVPGLIDSHIHQIMLATNMPNVRLLDARSVDDVLSLIGDRVKETPKGEWVIASSGWHESMLAEERLPTRWELDRVSPDNPVMIPRGGHVVTVNSKALERAGITNDTPNPAGGVIVRDPGSGEATGVLLEAAAYFARSVAPPPPPVPVMAERLREAMAELNGYGIVGIVDPVVDERTIEVYRHLHASGGITVRSDLLYYARDKAMTEAGIAAMKARESDDMLRYAGIKYMLDGGVEGGRLYEPYRIVPGEQPDPDYRGLLMLPPGGEDELVDALALVAEAGLQAQIHGVGDETIDVIARAFARVDARIPIAALRWAIMHVFLPSAESIRTMLDSGIVATVQDHPVLLGHNKRRWWGDERAAKAIPIRTLIDSGLLVGGGSDGPVVPVDPFLSMWWMVTRQTLKGYALGEDEAISAAEALALYTVNNAKVLGLEDEAGSIEPGKRADLAVLSQDILAVDPDRIRDTKALLTVVGGKIVHRDGF